MISFYKVMDARPVFYTLLLLSEPFVIPRDQRKTVAEATAPEHGVFDLKLMKTY